MKIYWTDERDLKDYYKETSGLKPIKVVAVDELIKEIEILKDRFGARPKADKGEKQDRFISYLDLLNSLSNEKEKEGG